MAGKKRKYQPKAFESTGKSNDTSANIYASMLESPAFMSLTKNQRLLYLYIKKQYYGVRKPGRDYPDIPELQDDRMFYFNLALAVKYNLYTRSNRGKFYEDMKELEDKGFIVTIVNGRANKKRSIYMFSDNWQL